MDDDAPDSRQPCPDELRRAERKRRGRVVIMFGVLVASVDTVLFCWVIPWVDRQDWAVTRHGSVGYVVFFAMVFSTFIAFLASVAYYFSLSSYPSDGWQ